MARKKHPADIINRELKKRKWSRNTLANTLDIGVGQVSELCNRKRRVTPALALKLEALGIEAREWLRVQGEYDLFKQQAPKYKIVRYFYKSQAYVTLKGRFTLEEAKAHCEGPEGSSKTAQSAANKRRTTKFGHWFDTHELDRGG